MTLPAYHLRPNKAVDRLVFVDAIRRLHRIDSLSDYTYYGFGGPYLEDFRLLYESFEGIDMVSIEEDSEVFKRQEFHLPFSTLQICNMNSGEFISDYEPGDNKLIVWLDYTDTSVKNLGEFQELLSKIAEGSMVKITFRAHRGDILGEDESGKNRWGVFIEDFYEYMLDPAMELPPTRRDYVQLIQDMAQMASEITLSGQVNVFQPINSLRYSDGTDMLTLTGIVCLSDELQEIRDAFEDWEFANLDWDPPKRIEVPFLSTKERLYLQSKLPCDEGSAGEVLHSALGYLIGKSDSDTRRQLESYSLFHRQYPYFIRAMP